MFRGLNGMNLTLRHARLGSESSGPDVSSVSISTKAGNGAFVNISRSDFERTRDERIQDPNVMHQKVASLCGPASFLHILAKHRSGDYYNFVTDLYEKGEASVGTFKVKPGEDCKKITLKSLAAADWVGMASIRDSENALFDYDDEDDLFPGITLPHELSGWFKKAGIAVEAEEANVVVSRGEKYLRAADSFRKAGCEVCLLINAEMLTAGKLKPRRHPFYLPDHWIVLNSDVTFMPGRVSFEVFTWGKGDWPVPQTPPCEPKAIYDNFFGFIAVRP